MQAMTKRAIRNRLIQAAVAALVGVWGVVLASFGQLRIRKSPGGPPDLATPTEVLIGLSGAAVALIAGVVAVRLLSRAVRLAVRDQVGDARSAPAGLVVSIFGYLVVVFTVLSALQVDMGGLLLGGAVTGVIVGIAAQQTMGNFFAGLVLLMVRPFTVGEKIVLRSGPLGGEYEGTVTEMSLFYMHLATEAGPVALPNAGVLASAVGPGARSPQEEDEPPDDEGLMHGGTA